MNPRRFIKEAAGRGGLLGWEGRLWRGFQALHRPQNIFDVSVGIGLAAAADVRSQPSPQLIGYSYNHCN